jgi:uncharacterized protein YecT (DUF1311 family)
MRFIFILSAVAVLASTSVSAELAPCPYADGDSCLEWRFERLDNELALLIAAPSEWIDMLPVHLRDEARAALADSQIQWLRFRDAECRRELTWSFATARTPRGFVAYCRLNMTFHRLNKLKELYKFKSR